MHRERRGQSHPLQLRRPGKWRPYFERKISVLPWNNPRDWGVAIQDRQRTSCAYLAQMLAQAAFQIGDAYVRHSHIIAIYGHHYYAMRRHAADAQIDESIRLKQQLMDEIAGWMKEASITQAAAAEVLKSRVLACLTWLITRSRNSRSTLWLACWHALVSKCVWLCSEQPDREAKACGERRPWDSAFDVVSSCFPASGSMSVRAALAHPSESDKLITRRPDRSSYLPYSNREAGEL